MTTAIETVKPDSPFSIKIRTESTGMVDTAKDLVIDSNDMYEIGAESIRVIAEMSGVVETERQKIAKPLYDAFKATNAHFKPFSDALTEADGIIRKKMLAFNVAQEQKRKNEEAEAFRVAEEKRKEELKKLQAEQAEQKAIQDAKTTEAVALIESGDIAGAEAAATAALEASNKVEDVKFEAAVAITAPITIAAPTTLRAGAKGTNTVDKWDGEVKDFAAMVKFIAANPMFLELLQPNETAIRKLAENFKGNAKVDGVEFTNNPGLRVTKKK